MDSDFEEKCQKISKMRKDRKVSVSKYLPPYINTPDMVGHLTNNQQQQQQPQEDNGKIDGNLLDGATATSGGNTVTPSSSKISPCRKRKISSWQRGFLNSKKKRRRERANLSATITEDQVRNITEK